MHMQQKGQGGIEYLLIIGAALLVVALVVVAVTGVLSSGKSTQTTTTTTEYSAINSLRTLKLPAVNFASGPATTYTFQSNEPGAVLTTIFSSAPTNTVVTVITGNGTNPTCTKTGTSTWTGAACATQITPGTQVSVTTPTAFTLSLSGTTPPSTTQLITSAGINPATLSARYEFENNLNDSSPNLKTGTAQGTLSFDTGKTGNGLVASPASYLSLPQSILTGDTNYTFMTWIKTDANYAVLLYEDNWNNYLYYYWRNMDVCDNAYCTTYNNLPTINNNQWHHLALSRSSNQVILYIDCTQVGSPLTTSGALSPSGLYLNEWFGDNQSNITYDDTYFFNTNLSQTQIKALTGC